MFFSIILQCSGIRRSVVKKHLFAAAVVFAFTSLLMCVATTGLILIGTSEVSAYKVDKPNFGYCPTGTCGRAGGRHAGDIKNCSANNCPWAPAAVERPTTGRPPVNRHRR